MPVRFLKRSGETRNSGPSIRKIEQSQPVHLSMTHPPSIIPRWLQQAHRYAPASLATSPAVILMAAISNILLVRKRVEALLFPSVQSKPSH